jgi:nucleoside-diphosphate-sugar epimerase
MQLNHPHVVLPDGQDVPQQFVHEDDLAAATWCILNRGGRGPYNLAPPDWIYLTDIARETNRRTVRFPMWLINLASKVCWTLRLPMLPYPPGMNAYVRHSYVMAPNRLCQELGYQFQFSTLGALRALIASHAKSARPGRSTASPACPSGHRRAG